MIEILTNTLLALSLIAVIINIVFTIYQVIRINKYYRMKMCEYEMTKKIVEIIHETIKEIKNEN